MYNVWNTVHPDEVEKVIDYANEARYGVQNEKVKEDSIIVTDHW